MQSLGISTPLPQCTVKDEKDSNGDARQDRSKRKTARLLSHQDTAAMQLPQ